MKKLIAATLALGMSLSLAACGGGSNPTPVPENSTPAAANSTTPSSGDNVVKIGVLLPFSGSSSYFGESQLKGYEHALEDYLAHYEADLNGMKIELVMGDTAGVADTGVTEAERLINDEGVSAIIGTYNSGTAAAIAPLAIKYKTPFMVTNAVSDVILAEESNYVFRTNVGDADAAPTYVSFLKWLGEQGGHPIEKVAILYEGTDYGQGSRDSFANDVLPAVGAEIVFDESYTSNSVDLSTVINKIKNSGADLVIPIMFLNDALLFSRQMKEFEVNIPVMGLGGGFSGDDYVNQAGDTSTYVMVGSSWLYDENILDEEALAYSKRFIEETGNTVPNEPYANGWMGMYALLEGIARAGSGDRDAIANALDTTDIPVGDRSLLFHATFGGIKYEDINGRYNQNSMSSMMYGQVLDGRYQIIYPANPETGETPVVFPVPAYSERG